MIRSILSQFVKGFKLRPFNTMVSLVAIALSLSTICALVAHFNQIHRSNPPESNKENRLFLTLSEESGEGQSSFHSRMSFGKALYTKIVNNERSEFPTYCSYSPNYYRREFYNFTKRFVINWQRVDFNFFHVFDFPFVSGDAKKEYDDALTVPQVVISERLANFYFGSIDCVGKTLKDRYTSYRVVGVTDEFIGSSDIVSDMYLIVPNSDVKGAQQIFTNRVFLCQQSEDREGLQKKLDKFASAWNKKEEKQITCSLSTRPEIELAKYDVSYVFLLLIVFIFPTFCLFDFLKRGSSRRIGEFGIRRSFGATRRDLFLYLFGDHILLVWVGGGISILLTFILSIQTLSISWQDCSTLFIHWKFLSVYFGVLLFMALIAGALPALHMVKNPIVQLLSQSLQSKFSFQKLFYRRRLYFTSFVLLTMNIAVFLGCFTFFENKSNALVSLKPRLPLPLEDVHSAEFQIQSEDQFEIAKLETMRRSIARAEGVESCAFVKRLDLKTAIWWGHEAFSKTSYHIACSESFGEVFDLELLHGKWFAEQDYEMGEPIPVVITSALAKKKGFAEGEINKVFSEMASTGKTGFQGFGDSLQYRVVGIVDNLPINDVLVFRAEALQPMFMPFATLCDRNLNYESDFECLFRSSSDISTKHLYENVTKVVSSIEYNSSILHYELKALRSRVWANQKEWFSNFVLILVAMVLFFLYLTIMLWFGFSRIVSLRLKEIGIRRALGHTTFQVLSFLGKEIGGLILLSFALGTLFCYQVFSIVSWELSLFSFSMCVLVSLLLLLLCLPIPLHKALSVQPISVIQED